MCTLFCLVVSDGFAGVVAAVIHDCSVSVPPACLQVDITMLSFGGRGVSGGFDREERMRGAATHCIETRTTHMHRYDMECVCELDEMRSPQ